MKQRPLSPPGRTRGSGRITLAQIVVLMLAGLLCIAWLVIALLLLRRGTPTTSNPVSVPVQAPKATGGAEIGQLTPVAVQPTFPLAGQPADGHALPFECAMQNNGITEGSQPRIIDPLTVAVEAGGQTVLVGYAGIRIPPETANQAMQKAQELFSGHTILLVENPNLPEMDATGRAPRYVFAGSQFVNFELVRYGLAVALPDSPAAACNPILQEAERIARDERLGIWKPTPVPTSTFMPLVTLDPALQACDCSIRYECSDFTTRAAAQTCYNACNDYSSKLDVDRDGIACEHLP